MKYTDTPHVYVDMDGVLCDLFSTITYKFFGKNYEHTTPEEKAESKKIWLDRRHFAANFGGVQDLFATLPPFGLNGELTKTVIETVYEFAGEYSICSHPSSIDYKACKKGKEIWIDSNLNPQPKNIFFPQNKSQYAITNGVPAILIDDFPKYIEGWRQAGGVAIELRTGSFTSAVLLKEFLRTALEEAKNDILGKNYMPEFEKVVEDIVQKFSVA